MIRNAIIVHGLNKAHGGYTPSLSVTPLTAHYDEEGGFETITVVVADPTQVWAVVCSQAWFSILGASLEGDDTFRIICDAQPEGAQPPRSGTVTVTSNLCADKVITVSQDARAG